MMKIFKILLALNLLLLCSKASFGQLVSDAYCKEFENAVATPFNPAHWYSNIVFEDDCWFEFDIDFKGGTGILFNLERYETEKATRKELRSHIEMYEAQHFLDNGEDFKFLKYDKSNFWDEAYFSESYGPMMLRKRRTKITIFCDKKELCPQIEKSLRQLAVLEKY